MLAIFWHDKCTSVYTYRIIYAFIQYLSSYNLAAPREHVHRMLYFLQAECPCEYLARMIVPMLLSFIFKSVPYSHVTNTHFLGIS